MRVQVLDHGYIELVESWGSDERIIEAARMSTDKGFLGWDLKCEKCNGTGAAIAAHLLEGGYPCKACNGKGTAGDEKLLAYLYTHKHMTPFEMPGMTIEVQAPIFVFREWHRHRVPFGYNEMSGRYTELPRMCYVPSEERIGNARQSTGNKQSSQKFEEDEAKMVRATVRTAFIETYNVAWAHYQEMLSRGVARELAARVLPTAQYSRMRATGNLRGWLAFLTLRIDTAAQWEIRQYANEVGKLVEAKFPRTWQLFTA